MLIVMKGTDGARKRSKETRQQETATARRWKKGANKTTPQSKVFYAGLCLDAGAGNGATEENYDKGKTNDTIQQSKQTSQAG